MKFSGIMIANSGDTTIVSLSGRIVCGIGSELLRETLARCASQSTRHVVVDLAGLTTLDAAGLGHLAYYYGQFQFAGIRMQVIHPRSWIKEMFRMTGLTRLLGHKCCRRSTGVARCA